LGVEDISNLIDSRVLLHVAMDEPQARFFERSDEPLADVRLIDLAEGFGRRPDVEA
jgi:hypothetical protein